MVDPVDDVILRFDSHERYIPAGLKRLLHLRQPTCGCGCGLPAHRADLDHIQPFEHDGRTRQENLHVLCRPSHLARHAGFADVTIDEDGTPLWQNKWGGVQRMRTGLRIKAVDDTDVTPF